MHSAPKYLFAERDPSHPTFASLLARENLPHTRLYGIACTKYIYSKCRHGLGLISRAFNFVQLTRQEAQPAGFLINTIGLFFCFSCWALSKRTTYRIIFRELLLKRKSEVVIFVETFYHSLFIQFLRLFRDHRVCTLVSENIQFELLQASDTLIGARILLRLSKVAIRRIGNSTDSYFLLAIDIYSMAH